MQEAFDAIRILAGLRSHGVSYVLVGGLGAAVRGASIETDDVDICLPDDQENLARLAFVLQQLGARLGSPSSEGDHRVSYDTSFGRLDCFESASEFASLDANASDVDVGHGVMSRVASLDDLARLKRASADLEGAVRLAALAAPSEGIYDEQAELVEADPPPNGRIDRFLEKLGSVDVFLTDLNNGKSPRRRKRA